MKPEQAKKEIEQLTDQINHHNHLYYQQHKTEISDFEFDQLLERLIVLENQFPQFRDPLSPTQRVGGAITKEFPTVYHRYPMLSLGNTYSPAELEEFDGRVSRGLDGDPYEYFCELKFDGVSISLLYENHKFSKGVTRGDGVRGDEVSNNIKTIRSIPLMLKGKDIPESFEVRGEIFIPKEIIVKLNNER
jgi:DNA ligase (NAD+)